MDKVYGSHDTYSCRKSSQIGGNHWLWRVYVDDKCRYSLTGIEICVLEVACVISLWTYTSKSVRITWLLSEWLHLHQNMSIAGIWIISAQLLVATDVQKHWSLHQNLWPLQLDQVATLSTFQIAPPLRDSRRLIISVDFIIELPQAHGYDTIMVVINSVTKYMHFILTHTTINVKAARLYLREVWKHHSIPRAVLSDRGSQFIVEFMWEVYQWLRIKFAMWTDYHSQTDGQTKYVDQELEGYLRNFTNQCQDNWNELASWWV
jgi:hypothetical protein